MKWSSKRVLVTGGAGFMGSHLVRNLHSKNAYVIVTDNLSTGDIRNINGYASEVICKDIDDMDFVETFEDKDIEYIFHFGAPSSVILFNRNPTECVQETIFGFINIMELARALNVKKVVYPSSGSVYGNIPTPQSEEASPRPPNLYGVCKLSCEKIAKLYDEVPSIGLRVFAGYGPGEDQKGDIASVVTLFLKTMIRNERPVIYGDGSQSRDFVYVDDVIKAIMKSAEIEHLPLIINVGSGESYSFNQVITLLNNLLGKNVEPRYVPKPVQYLEKTQAETTLMRRKLSIEPLTLKDGTRRYLDALEIGTVN